MHLQNSCFHSFQVPSSIMRRVKWAQSDWDFLDLNAGASLHPHDWYKPFPLIRLWHSILAFQGQGGYGGAPNIRRHLQSALWRTGRKSLYLNGFADWQILWTVKAELGVKVHASGVILIPLLIKRRERLRNNHFNLLYLPRCVHVPRSLFCEQSR